MAGMVAGTGAENPHPHLQPLAERAKDVGKTFKSQCRTSSIKTTSPEPPQTNWDPNVQMPRTGRRFLVKTIHMS